MVGFLYTPIGSHVDGTLVDMLGFKLEMPQREDSLKDKARPIYLDMQVLRNPVLYRTFLTAL